MQKGEIPNKVNKQQNKEEKTSDKCEIKKTKKQDLIRQNQNKTMGIDDVWEFKEGVSRFVKRLS